MSLAERSAVKARPGALPGSARATLLLFAAALFLSALLLFAVQPLFAKMVLPRLGGSPQVWSVLMVCFQAVLLAGYAYAHVLIRAFGARRSAPVHLFVLTAAIFTLPIGVAAGWEQPPADGQSLWLIGLFAASVAVPFFAVSANAPLLQAWFARSGHAQASDPYFLYGASNIGSFAALLSYPVVVEPLFRLPAQGQIWSGGFFGLILLVAAAGLLTIQAVASSQPGEGAQEAGEADAVSPARRAGWVALAFVPSGLLVAVTAHISTDIAAAPFLWVLPLALFLATFVLTFRTTPAIRPQVLLAAHALLVAFYAVAPLNLAEMHIGVIIAFHLGLFFVSAMVCHSELYRQRPPAGRLTEFYLWMSLGGVAGGLFAGLLAPMLFSSLLEYPLLIGAALLCNAVFWRRAGSDVKGWGLAAALGVLLFAPKLTGIAYGEAPKLVFIAVAGILVVIVVRQRSAPVRLFAFALVVFLASSAYAGRPHTLEQMRSFFGVHRIQDTADGAFRLLVHGTTIHGAQALDRGTGKPRAGRPAPRTYYHYGGPLGQAVAAMRPGGGYGNVGVVGLGTGSLACHAHPGEAWSFYEIDPEVVRIARNEEHFRFLAECAPTADIIVGDARMTLARQPAGRFDLLVLDAFSSDAIPVHLLTREAFGLYARLLRPRGNLLFHISNRHMELASVLAAVAAEHGWQVQVRDSSSPEPFDTSTYFAQSIAAVATRDDAHIGDLAGHPDWALQDPGTTRAWSDDYSNILSAIIRRRSAD